MDKTKEKLLMSDTSTWQEKFKEASASIAFNITLSKRMVWMLLALNYHKGYPDECRMPWSIDTFISTGRACIERGLVRHDRNIKPHWFLTPAGHAVVSLLDMAGHNHKCFKCRIR